MQVLEKSINLNISMLNRPGERGASVMKHFEGPDFLGLSGKLCLSLTVLANL